MRDIGDSFALRATSCRKATSRSSARSSTRRPSGRTRSTTGPRDAARRAARWASPSKREALRSPCRCATADDVVPAWAESCSPAKQEASCRRRRGEGISYALNSGTLAGERDRRARGPSRAERVRRPTSAHIRSNIRRKLQVAALHGVARGQVPRRASCPHRSSVEGDRGPLAGGAESCVSPWCPAPSRVFYSAGSGTSCSASPVLSLVLAAKPRMTVGAVDRRGHLRERDLSDLHPGREHDRQVRHVGELERERARPSPGRRSRRSSG